MIGCIGISLGDVTGIGPEVTLKALAAELPADSTRYLLIGDAACVQRLNAQLGLKLDLVPLAQASSSARITVTNPLAEPLPEDLVDGSPLAARAAVSWLKDAAQRCLRQELDAMVTAPVNKEAFSLAGIADTGHQEVLARLSGATNVKTMLVSGRLRCMHLSTHKSLAEACHYVTRANVLDAVMLTHEHFVRWGFANPRIAVAALNPHASDNGLIGREELDEIAPAVADARAKGVNASGPIPADSVFNAAIAGKHDVVVVMYHDQGHIPIKVHGFEQSVSVNLGLPFLRTSVDHGTAFDIAGRGVADETSMVEAITLAVSLANGAGL